MSSEKLEVLISEEQIAQRVDELAAQLRADYGDKNPLFVGILRSCYVFMADVIRKFGAPCDVDFLAVSSYGEGVVLSRDVGLMPMGRHVVVLESLLDSGRTMSFVTNLLSRRGVASLEVCTLLDKPGHREVPQEAKYVGFTVPDAFVVGYGMDEDEGYRYLPYIGVLRDSDD